jgi:predicted nuclease of predicted toxin-antitoxin system
VRFKIDENLPPEASTLLQNSGHDALTVWEQRLQGRPDLTIARVCQEEQRIFITLDLDFADIRTYPPNQYSGLIVMRLNSQSRTSVLRALQGLLPILEKERIDGHLWIVDETTVRIHGEGENGR